MGTLNIFALQLITIGGLNWLFQADLVASLSGGQASGLARVVYMLVAISAVGPLILFFRSSDAGEVRAECGR